MKLIKLLFFVSIPCMLNGQDISGYNFETGVNDLLNPSPHIMSERKGGAAYGTEGSPMILDEYTKGNIYYSNKSKTSAILINYDCYNNRVFYSDGTNEYVLPSKEIDFLEFTLNDQSLVFKHIFLEDLKQSLFVQVLYNNQSILYKRHYRQFLKADYDRAYGSDRRYDEYKNLYKYYISLDGVNSISFKPRKKDLLNIMNEHRNDIEAYLKAEKNNLKSDTDLVKLVKYYDSLTTPTQRN